MAGKPKTFDAYRKAMKRPWSHLNGTRRERRIGWEAWNACVDACCEAVLQTFDEQCEHHDQPIRAMLALKSNIGG